jgi:glutamyl-tRNA synthetase
VAGFDLGAISRTPPRFDPAALAEVSAKTLHLLPFDAVAARLPAGATEKFWLTVRENLATIAEAAAWLRIVIEGADPHEAGDPSFLATAAELLPAEPFDEATWPSWTRAVGAATGLKGKALFLPLRRALTGRDHGPDLKALLPLFSRASVLARLEP